MPVSQKPRHAYTGPKFASARDIEELRAACGQLARGLNEVNQRFNALVTAIQGKVAEATAQADPLSIQPEPEPAPEAST